MTLFQHGIKLFSRQIARTFISQTFNPQRIFKMNNNHPSIRHVVGNVCPLHTSSHKPQQSRRTPDLIYVPHIFRWLKNKFRFKYLQKMWDPDFSEGAFIYGTTKAVCRITEIIHVDKPHELQGLLTESATIKLIDDMNTRLTKQQKKIIKIRPDDIKILVPTSVNLKTEGISKKCEVSLRSLALKWFEEGGSLKLVLVALQTDFVRDYTKGATEEWTISAYDVLECAMLSEAPTST